MDWYVFTVRKLSPPDESHSKADSGQPRSSDRALHILKFVGRSPTGTSLTDAAANAELPISTALRQLRSLESAGLVRRDADTQLFYPGVELVRLAYTVISATPVTAVAQSHLDSLAARTKESCYLAVPQGPRHAVYIAAAPGTHQLRHTGWLDKPIPRRNTAVGAALGASSIASFTRHDGIEDGVTAISCPVIGGNGWPIAAISIVGPSFRFTPTFLRASAKHLVVTAGLVSHAIGQPEVSG